MSGAEEKLEQCAREARVIEGHSHDRVSSSSPPPPFPPPDDEPSVSAPVTLESTLSSSSSESSLRPPSPAAATPTSMPVRVPLRPRRPDSSGGGPPPLIIGEGGTADALDARGGAPGRPGPEPERSRRLPSEDEAPRDDARRRLVRSAATAAA